MQETKTHEVVYRGEQPSTGGPGEVTVVEDDTERTLDPRTDIANHSPSGVSWGFRGSGPRQLAIALLADVYGDDLAADPHASLHLMHELTEDLDNEFEVSAAQIKSIMSLSTEEYETKWE